MFDIKNIFEPETLSEALSLYESNPSLKIIAGGTDVLINMHHGKGEGIELLSLQKLGELKEIKLFPDGAISIGALATFTQVFRNEIINQSIPILAEAAVSMGGPQIRNAATLGGNIANGAVSADSAPSLFTLNALLKLETAANERLVPITGFYSGPGKVKFEPSEILTEIIITKDNYDRFYGKYIKFSERKAMDIAKLSVAVLSKAENGEFTDLRIALGVAAPTPVRCIEAEAFAKGLETSEENIKAISALTLKNAHARDSWRGSKDYREHLIRVLSERAIKAAIGGNFNV